MKKKIWKFSQSVDVDVVAAGVCFIFCIFVCFTLTIKNSWMNINKYIEKFYVNETIDVIGYICPFGNNFGVPLSNGKWYMNPFIYFIFGFVCFICGVIGNFLFVSKKVTFNYVYVFLMVWVFVFCLWYVFSSEPLVYLKKKILYFHGVTSKILLKSLFLFDVKWVACVRVLLCNHLMMMENSWTWPMEKKIGI